MDQTIFYTSNTTVTYVVVGILTAALAGILGYFVWLLMSKTTGNYHIKNAMNFLRMELICLVVPLIFPLIAAISGRITGIQIVQVNLPMYIIILPLFIVWLSNIAVVIRECRQRYIAMDALCAQNIPAGEEEKCYIYLDKWKEKMKLKKKIEIFNNSLITSPALVYHRGYKLLLPVCEIWEEELNITILHELTHCKHHDLMVKHALLITSVIHCFHPLCSVLRKDIDRWAEVDCDFSSCDIGEEEFGRNEYFDYILKLRARNLQKQETDISENIGQQCNLYDGDSLLPFRVEMMHRLKGNYRRFPIFSRILTLVLAAVIMAGAWMLSVKVMKLWFMDNLNWEEAEVVEQPQEITDVTAEEFFEGTKVVPKSTDILNQEENTVLSIGAGETWVFDVSGEEVSWVTVFAEDGQKEPIDYRAGYIDDSGRLVLAEGNNAEIRIIYGIEDEGVQVTQIVIQNCGGISVDIELMLDFWE